MHLARLGEPEAAARLGRSRSEIQVHLDGFLADYDAVRLVFSCKGASGMKLCALCSNVLAKGRAEAEADDFFVTISSWEPSRFVGYDTTEFFNNYDEQLQKAERLNKSAQKEQENLFGFVLHQNCLFADRPLRNMLNLEHLIIDSFHCYYANGIASQELVLMMRFVDQQCNITTEMWLQTIREVPWQCRDENLRAPSGRSYLFQSTYWTGEMFKGSASQVWYYTFICTK